MTPESVVEELRARLQLAQGSPTLLLVIAESDAALPQSAQVLLELLRATPMGVGDLGECSSSSGPARWAEQTRRRDEQAFVLTFVPSSPLAVGAFARLLNAERELLRRIGGPTVLVISPGTERALRQGAPDFFTWIAQTYELPAPRELQALAGKAGIELAPAAPAEDPIRFLHLSDLHLRPQRVKRYDQDRVLAGLLAFLERDRKSFPLDLIFVTGDLAHSGKADEYALVVELLRRLMAVTAVAPERIFVVPGNHDVDRDVGRWLLRTLTRDEDAVAFFEDPASRTFHAQKHAAYRASLGPLLGPARPLGLGVGADAVELLEIKGARLAVASFNTAWFANGDDDHGKLWLGEPAVERAADRVADDEAAFAVALMHHPFDELHEIEREVVERWIERGFDMVCRGHLHANKTRSIASQRGGFVEVAAPAAYQGSPWPNGCFLGEIRPRARTVTLRPYTFSSGPDPWVLDTRVFPDDEADGYRRTFTVPTKSRRKSSITRQLRAAAEAAVKAASPVQRAEIEKKLANMAPSAPVAARALAESPELWSEVLDRLPHGAGRLLMLSEAITEHLRSERAGEPPLALDSASAFEQAIRQAGRAYLVVSARIGARGRLEEKDAAMGLAAALGAIVSRHVGFDFRMVDGRRRSDVLIRRSDRSGVEAIIEVSRVGSELHAESSRSVLEQLDAYMRASGAEYAALVLLDALPPDSTEPEIEHAQTPGGRDVVVMRL